MPTTINYTDVIVAALPILATIILGLLQFGKWKSEAKKATTDAHTDLVKVALEINKQEIETLRNVIQTQKDTITDLKQAIKDNRSEAIEMGHEHTVLHEDNSLLKLSLEAVQCELEAEKKRNRGNNV